tara:strand:- start:60 stop:419 length:360 start_codon:yes stop_codon:yes gene_type:complete
MSNYIKWNGTSEDGSDGDKKWSEANLTWGDYQLLVELEEEVIKGGRSSSLTRQQRLDKYLDKDEDKKKRLIKLIATVQGQKFEEEKEVEDVQINVSDVEVLIKEILSKIKNIIVEKKDV